MIRVLLVTFLTCFSFNAFSDDYKVISKEDFEPYNFWYGAYLFNKKAGYVNIKSYTIKDKTDITFCEEYNYHFEIMTESVLQSYNEATIKKYDLYKKLKSITTKTNTIIKNKNNIKTELNDEKKIIFLEDKIEIYQGDKKQIIDYHNSNKLEYGAEQNLYIKVNNVGDIESLTYFDPSIMKMVKLYVAFKTKKSININGVILDVKQLSQTIKTIDDKQVLVNDINIFVDEHGKVVKMDTSNGKIVLRLEDEKIAKSSFEYPDVIEESKIKVIGNTHYFESQKDIFLKIFPLSEYSIKEDFQDVVQKIGANTYIIKLNKIEIKKNEYKIITSEQLDSALNKYLQSSLIIDYNEESLLSLSQKICKGKTTILDKVKSLNNWINMNIKKEYLGTIISASEILKIKKGDCSEYSILFAALSRASGVPTKVVFGLVYLPIKNSFYYHSWNEIYTDRWLPVDVTFDQIPTSLGHIKLSEGDYDDSNLNLSNNFLTNITIEIIDELKQNR